MTDVLRGRLVWTPIQDLRYRRTHVYLKTAREGDDLSIMYKNKLCHSNGNKNTVYILNVERLQHKLWQNVSPFFLFIFCLNYFAIPKYKSKNDIHSFQKGI